MPKESNAGVNPEGPRFLGIPGIQGNCVLFDKPLGAKGARAVLSTYGSVDYVELHASE